MGRGRAKAKQVKVARQLKYKSSDGSDLDRLRAEIAAGTDSHNGTSGESDFDDDEDDRDVPETEDAWRLGLATRLDDAGARGPVPLAPALADFEDELAPVAFGDRDGVFPVEAGPAQPGRR